MSLIQSIQSPRISKSSFLTIRQIEEQLSTFTGLCFDLIITGERNDTFRHSDFTPLCQLVHTSPCGKEACNNCTKKSIEQIIVSKETIISKCHIGLIDAYIPLIFNNKVVGVLACGQFLFMEPSYIVMQQILNRLKELDVYLTFDDLSSIEIPVYSEQKFKAITKLLSSFNDFLLTIELINNEITFDNIESPWEKAKYIIENEYMNPLSVNDIAKAINISSSHLSHLFSKQIGMSLSTYIAELRIKKSLSYLEKTNMGVYEISERVGFNSQSHFNHMFKKFTGTTPSNYRKTIKNLPNS